MSESLVERTRRREQVRLAREIDVLADRAHAAGNTPRAQELRLVAAALRAKAASRHSNATPLAHVPSKMTSLRRRLTAPGLLAG